MEIPLKFYEDLSAFKLYLLDCGLFGCMADAPASQMLVGNNIFKEFKGAFTGQLQDWMENIPLYGLYKYFREK